MKANELRIGNYILDSDYRKIIKSNTRYINIMLSEERVKGKTTFKPIPLTEEILLKCGFKKQYHSADYYKDGLELNINDSKIEFNYSIISDFNKHLEYLHQLQNLYFALTGKELEIKL